MHSQETVRNKSTVNTVANVRGMQKCSCFRTPRHSSPPSHEWGGLLISSPFVWSVMYALDWSSGIGTRERKMLM